MAPAEPAVASAVVEVVLGQEVALVPDLEQAGRALLRVDAELVQDRLDIVLLRVAVGVADVAHVQDQVGREHLFQRGAEGRDQRGRQVGDEAHRVGEDDMGARRQGQLAHGRIKGGEDLVARVDSGPGEAVEQGRLAGIGVADQGHDGIGHALAGFTVQAAGAPDAGQLLLDPYDPLGDPAPVELELALAGPTEEAEAAALALEVGPGAYQPRALVGERGQLDLEHALAGMGALAEDLQDQAGAVDDLGLPQPLEVALLHRRQRGVDHDQLRRARSRVPSRTPWPCPSRTGWPAPSGATATNSARATSRSMARAKPAASARRLAGVRAPAMPGAKGESTQARPPPWPRPRQSRDVRTWRINPAAAALRPTAHRAGRRPRA